MAIFTNISTRVATRKPLTHTKRWRLLCFGKYFLLVSILEHKKAQSLIASQHKQRARTERKANVVKNTTRSPTETENFISF